MACDHISTWLFIGLFVLESPARRLDQLPWSLTYHSSNLGALQSDQVDQVVTVVQQVLQAAVEVPPRAPRRRRTKALTCPHAQLRVDKTHVLSACSHNA